MTTENDPLLGYTEESSYGPETSHPRRGLNMNEDIMICESDENKSSNHDFESVNVAPSFEQVSDNNEVNIDITLRCSYCDKFFEGYGKLDLEIGQSPWG